MEVGGLVVKDKTVHKERAAGTGKVAGKDRKERAQSSMALIGNLVTLESTAI